MIPCKRRRIWKNTGFALGICLSDSIAVSFRLKGDLLCAYGGALGRHESSLFDPLWNWVLRKADPGVANQSADPRGRNDVPSASMECHGNGYRPQWPTRRAIGVSKPRNRRLLVHTWHRVVAHAGWESGLQLRPLIIREQYRKV